MDTPCLGLRRRSLSPSGRILTTDSSYSFLSYRAVYERYTHVGRGLQEFVASTDYGPGFVAIVSGPTVEAVVVDLACISVGLVPVFMPTTTVADLGKLLLQLDARLVVCAAKQLDNVRLAITVSRCPVRNVVVLDGDSSLQSSEKTQKDQPFVTSLEKVEAQGILVAQLQPRRRLASNKQLFTLLWTSGSSGLPKGAMRSTRQWLDLICYFTQGAGRDAQKQVLMAYAPLSHIMERSSIWVSLATGSQIALFDGDAAELLEEARIVEPTTFSAAPSIWNSLFSIFQHRRSHLLSLLPAKEERKASDDEEVARVDKESLEYTRAFLGSRIKAVVTGGAHTSPEVMAFLHRCFHGCDVVDGYGMTEVGPVLVGGRPNPGVEIKLVDCEGYSTKDLPWPRGELYVRTPNTFSGYYKNEDKTNDVLKEGWCATGDIGMIDGEDRVHIIDRRGNCVKLSNGEFITAERLEGIFVQSELADQVFVTGNSFSSFVVALVVPTCLTLEKFKGRTSDELTAAVMDSIVSCGKAAGLEPFEFPKRIHVLRKPEQKFTAENLLLTSTYKLARKMIREKYHVEISDLYSSVETEAVKLERMLLSVLCVPTSNLKGDSDVKSEDNGGDMSFLSLGGDSLSALKFVNLIREHFHKELPLQVLLSAKSVYEIADFLRTQETVLLSQCSELDLAKQDMEFQINTSSLPKGHLPTAEATEIFLTGCTGFLGAHVFGELLCRTRARLHCLVRVVGETEEQKTELGLKRIQDVLALYRIQVSPTVIQERVVVVPGDLALPNFGLTEPVFASLAEEIEAIFHIGALVNWLIDYRTARGSNVMGTQTVLKLASSSRLKAVHFCSTVSTAASDGSETLLSKDVFNSLIQLPHNGYGSSKWVSEFNVIDASKKGIPVTVFRPGFIAGHTITGACNATDYLSRLLRAFVEMRAFIDSPEVMDTTPVDFVAAAIVQIALKDTRESAQDARGSTPLGLVFHLVNKRPLSIKAIGEVVADFVEQKFGQPRLPSTTYPRWRDALLSALATHNSNKQHPLAPLLSFFPSGPSPMNADFSSFSTANSQRFLASECPVAKKSHTRSHIAFLMSNNMFKL